METQAAANQSSTKTPHPLIASDRIEGTPVYGSDGYRIGAIKRMMIEKQRGSVAYVILSFGGVLGLGNDYCPVPWDLLSYNEYLGGYEVDISDTDLKNAPKFREENWDDGDRKKEMALFDYYGMGPYFCL